MKALRIVYLAGALTLAAVTASQILAQQNPPPCGGPGQPPCPAVVVIPGGPGGLPIVIAMPQPGTKTKKK